MDPRSVIIAIIFIITQFTQKSFGQPIFKRNCNDPAFLGRNPCIDTCEDNILAVCSPCGLCSCSLPCYTGTPTTNFPLNPALCPAANPPAFTDEQNDCSSYCLSFCGATGPPQALVCDDPILRQNAISNNTGRVCNCICAPVECPTTPAPTTGNADFIKKVQIVVVIVGGVVYNVFIIYFKLILFFLKILTLALIMVAIVCALLTFGLGYAYLPYYFDMYFNYLLQSDDNDNNNRLFIG